MKSTLLALGVLFCTHLACKKSEPGGSATETSALAIGLATDVGGRGDGSFNDSALRGLETWASSSRYQNGKYLPLSAKEYALEIPPNLAARIHPLGIKPVVVQSKSQEDYEPNLQLLVDQGAQLVVGVGFMLENAIERVALRNPKAHFLLIDSPLLDAQGKPFSLPNVGTVVFKEEEGSFLAGALAGKVAKKQIGFIGGMGIPLIKKFENGFRAGVMTTHPNLGATLLSSYTGSFDNVAAGKQVAQDLLAKGVDVLFHAAGSDGLGVIQAVKEAKDMGKDVWVIGVDSDQYALAPNAVLTSMVKRVDLAVYEATLAAKERRLKAQHVTFGLKEEGVYLADIRVNIPNKEQTLQEVETLRQKVVSGEILVPASAEALAAFKVAP